MNIGKQNSMERELVLSHLVCDIPNLFSLLNLLLYFDLAAKIYPFWSIREPQRCVLLSE